MAIANRIFKLIPITAALYSAGVFASATAIAQISAAGAQPNGIWVKLCATGTQKFIPLGNGEEPENPLPSTHAQACHACDSRRLGDIDDDCAA